MEQVLVHAGIIGHREARCSPSPRSPTSSGTERPARACSDLAGGHTALALRLSWLPGLGVVTGMPG